MPKTKGESKASPVLKDKDTPRTRRSKEKKEKEAKSRVSKEKELDGDAAASSPRSLRSFHFPSLPKKRSRGLWRSKKRKKEGAVFGLPLPTAAVADDSEVPVVLRMLLGVVEEKGLDTLGLYQTAPPKKLEAVRARIDDKGDYWLASDESLSSDEAALVAAELVRVYLAEQPDPLLVEPDVLAVAINEYRAGSELPAALISLVSSFFSALPTRTRLSLVALVRHANRVVSHGASNGTGMMGLAEALAEPTGARVDLLAFLFAHADEIGLGPGPGPCTREMYVDAIAKARSAETASGDGDKGGGSTSPRQVSCEDVIPDDEEERALAELRILDASLARHHDGIRAAAERGEAYPESAMEEMLNVQRKHTALKRELKKLESVSGAPAGGGASGGMAKQSAALAAEKIYEELLFEHDEMVAIEKMLRARIIQEKEGLAVAEAEVNRLGAVPMLEPQLAAIDDHKRLQTLLDSEMHKMDILDEERARLAAALLKERDACAQLNVQIRQLDPRTSVWDYNAWDREHADGASVKPTASPNVSLSPSTRKRVPLALSS